MPSRALTTKSYPAPSVHTAEVEKPCLNWPHNFLVREKRHLSSLGLEYFLTISSPPPSIFHWSSRTQLKCHLPHETLPWASKFSIVLPLSLFLKQVACSSSSFIKSWLVVGWIRRCGTRLNFLFIHMAHLSVGCPPHLMLSERDRKPRSLLCPHYVKSQTDTSLVINVSVLLSHCVISSLGP